MQPSISVILRDLGCLEQLVACTKYCVEAVPALRQQPIQIIHDSWSADTGEILAAKPSIVIASVPYRMESLAAILKAGVAVLAMAPHSLANIYEDIALIGRVVNVPERAAAVVDSMQNELEALRVRTADVGPQPLVYCEEWGKPLIHSQPWVDELIEIAGGRTFGNAGVTTSEEAVMLANPDVLLFSWCGAGDRVPLEKIVVQRGWQDMRAVQQRRVYCINDEWLNTPAPTLLLGARAIAAAIHPELFGAPQTPRRLRSS